MTLCQWAGSSRRLGGKYYFRNVRTYSHIFTASHPRRLVPVPSVIPRREPQISQLINDPNRYCLMSNINSLRRYISRFGTRNTDG